MTIGQTDCSDTNQRRLLRDAYDAVLAGDTGRRDRLLAGIDQAVHMDAKERALRQLAAIDFFVGPDGVAIRSRDVAAVAL